MKQFLKVKVKSKIIPLMHEIRGLKKTKKPKSVKVEENSAVKILWNIYKIRRSITQKAYFSE